MVSTDIAEGAVLFSDNACVHQGLNGVLESLNFSIQKGEFVYLVGQTGSGKSSLLKTLYADLPLRKGEILLDQFRLNGLSAKRIPYLRRRLGIVFQDFQLLFDRNVFDNLHFVLRATGWRRRFAIKKHISDILMRVGLGASSAKMPHQLSGGEQQRLVIARALLNDPLMLLADEPTGNLDPEVAEDILKLFLDINNAGTAILMATHNHSFLESHPARVLQCKDGKVLDSLKDPILDEKNTLRL